MKAIFTGTTLQYDMLTCCYLGALSRQNHLELLYYAMNTLVCLADQHTVYNTIRKFEPATWHVR